MGNKFMDDYLPTQVEITSEIIEDYRGRGKLSDLVLQLYREASSLCVLCAAADVEGRGSVLNRNQAICAGLLVRISKFMAAVFVLAKDVERGEVILALGRSITESVVNLRLLMSKNDDKLYDRYIADDLGSEREFYDIVKKQIEQQGRALPIQEDILSSIQKLVEDSGFDIEQVDPKLRNWAGGVRQRYEALGQADRYVTEERMGSHAVHGTWSDLLQHHLRIAKDGFVTNFDWKGSDGQLLSGVACVALEAASDYVDEFFHDVPGTQLLLDRIENLKKRIHDVETSREEWSVDDHSGHNEG
jgi:hypothetical protein